MKTIVFPFATALCILFVVFCGCSKDAVTTSSNSSLPGDERLSPVPDVAALAGYKTYVIDSGNHYANGKHFPLFSGSGISFSAIFDSSAIYNFTDPKTRYDQNTLYGFADNNKNHRLFSARFGWRWFDGSLQIAAYAFNNGDSTIVQMGSVPLGQPISYSIAINGDHYDFRLNDTGFVPLPRKSKTAKAGRYKLLPYFGGDAVAPHRVTIQIKEN